jgi:hypothetical protein
LTIKPSAVTPPKPKDTDKNIPAKIWYTSYYVPHLGIYHYTACAEYEGKIHSYSFNGTWNYDDSEDLEACKESKKTLGDADYSVTTKDKILIAYEQRVAADTGKYGPAYTCINASGTFIRTVLQLTPKSPPSQAKIQAAERIDKLTTIPGPKW